ncbi:hypothetical protein MBLNU230_g3139t1 [Neophaeotheca triangularis]
MLSSFLTKSAALATLFAAHATADITNIEIASNVSAGSATDVTFTGADTQEYRVYLAAAITGENGPTCYLENGTTLSSPLTIRIPPSVGPSADYYSIAIGPSSSSGTADLSYSPQFQLTNTTGTPSDYERALDGAPFWSPESLPCESYNCARECAQAGFPDDLTDDDAYDDMRDCILECDGVRRADPETGPTAPALATATEVVGVSATGAAASASASESDAAGRVEGGARAAAVGALGLAAFLL